MKLSKLSLLGCLVFVMLLGCKKDDDGNAEENAAEECEMWFEGNPCEAMITKFLGTYEGGAGFCGTNYRYIVTQTPNVVNGLTIRVENPDGSGGEITALLTSSTEFDIPPQGGANNDDASGFGNLNGNQLYFYYESPDGKLSCEHNATRI